MKKPNDTKRPNTHSGKETRERKRNYRYVWVSKPLVVVPDPELPGVKKIIPLPVGKTYWPSKGSKLSRKDRRAADRALEKTIRKENKKADERNQDCSSSTKGS